MHDDTDAGRLIPANGPPALAIDYLGGGWNNEDDIAASWKFMTKQKNDLINGLRLENASWRNWAKQRHNLKTISPKSLNWLKDSDTTWLYGPLYKAAIDEFDRSRFGAQTVAAAGESVSIPTTPTRHISDPILPTDLASAISTSTSSSSSTSTASTTSTTTGAGARGKMAGGLKNGPLKPVLKHKTASELFKADTLFHVQSDMRLNRRIDPINKARESAVFKQHRQPKLRFNDSVEQCVSIDTDVISEEDEDMGGYGSDSNNNSSTSGGSGSSSRSSENNNEKDDEDARVGLNGRHEDEDGGLLMRISVRRPPRSIVRIDSTTLKAASLHGMNENLEDPEDATTTEDEDDEGLFDEPIYLGNPYTGSGTAYVGSRQDAPYEAALDDVSYTRPLPPSPTVGSTVSNESSSSSTVFYSASSTTPNSSNSGSNASSIHGGIEVHQQQTPAFVVTQTSRPISSLLPPTGASTPLMDQTTTLTTPAPSAARTALASALEAEKAMAANGGMQQRATDLVANVKGLVNWASSFVFNSSTF
ncbi:hypothetical protein BGX23_006925 [Mortierella sp. AD031]|nr:hypothetical protein BGX23_006925 [Mortierella sp. AD031]KAG0210133.1 hypothetical protein BGX33_005112 [Mortierella sp. NVP41]